MIWQRCDMQFEMAEDVLKSRLTATQVIDKVGHYLTNPKRSIMKARFATLLSALVLLAGTSLAQAAEDPADIDAVVAAIKAANPDMKALCQNGKDAIRKASTEAVMVQMASGKIKGNPQAVGSEAGQKIAEECRGG